ncbi:MAG TPA: zinc-dependent metalloprotease, partial [Planctomycetota bacterium]|nr:zinc-dependent metalloprotease [Planctomycetota bacterium]
YSFDAPEKVLARVAEPALVYGTDEDRGGSDPRARHYDLGKDPLPYGENLIRLVQWHRKHLLDKFVKKGERWSRAREGYLITLNTQTTALSIVSNWLGGTYTNRDRKGDPGNRRPIEVVPADLQRKALQFTIENALRDEAFGLTPELMAYMTSNKDESFNSELEAWPVHDRILGIQASVLTMLMHPRQLARIYDNELRVPQEHDALTLPEVMKSLYDAVWSELTKAPEREYSPREPFISSLKRNLQREYLERLIDLTKPGGSFDAASKPISNLAMSQLRELHSSIPWLLKHETMLDAYSKAHLNEAHLRIRKVLDADFIWNASDFGSSGGYIIIGQEAKKEPEIAPLTPVDGFDPVIRVEDARE